MDDKLMTIGFRFVNEFGHEFTAESKKDYYSLLGETELSVIGECFNNFLRQIGFYRRNDYMLMDDLTEDELDALTDYLHQLRDAASADGGDA